MNPIQPMLAVPMRKGKVTDWSEWVVEEKYDGHRLVICIGSDGDVAAWTRPKTHAGFPGKSMAVRPLPPHLTAQLGQLPVGIYDGELLAGDTATDVTRLDLRHQLHVVLFDVMSTGREGRDNVTSKPYDERRVILLEAHKTARASAPMPNVKVTASHRVKSMEDVKQFVAEVWKDGGEGAILKRRQAGYVSKRSPDWIKVKRCEHATLLLVGFEKSRGKVLRSAHPFGIVVISDGQRRTTCKVKDDHELQRIVDAWRNGKATKPLPLTEAEAATHPWVGKRQLVIEFPQRTRDGNYQGPVIWDRWENE